MIKATFAVLPFIISLCWLVIHVLHWRQHNNAQHLLTLFAGVTAMLYGCHACYFLGDSNIYTETIWRMCSLSVYPLYYLYIVRLTTSHERLHWGYSLVLLPAALILVLSQCLPTEQVTIVQNIIFVLTLIVVCASGLVLLHRFETSVQNFYADTDDKSSRSISVLLIVFASTSVCSALFAAIGRESFTEDMLIAIPSLLFSCLLFAVFYLGDQYNFCAQTMKKEDLPEEETQEGGLGDSDFTVIAERLRHLMEDEHIFLEPNLKLSDIATKVGSCRTYLSNYINQSLHISFTDYINQQRIQYALSLMEDDPHAKTEYIATASGFASKQSFLRNFQKFTGTTPKEWESKH